MHCCDCNHCVYSGGDVFLHGISRLLVGTAGWRLAHPVGTNVRGLQTSVSRVVHVSGGDVQHRHQRVLYAHHQRSAAAQVRQNCAHRRVCYLYEHCRTVNEAKT